jgi:hypothetical protein
MSSRRVRKQGRTDVLKSCSLTECNLSVFSVNNFSVYLYALATRLRASYKHVLKFVYTMNEKNSHDRLVVGFITTYAISAYHP